LDLVLLDASVGREAYRRFPKGELREDLEALERANFFVYTKADSSEPALKKFFEQEHSYQKASAVFSFSLNKPMRITPANSIEMIDSDNPEYLLVTGVGNPRQVLKSFNERFGKEKAHMFYKDHHVFGPKDIENIEHKREQCGAKYIFCTEKDYLKIKNLMKNASALYYVPMKNEALKGEKELVEKISSLFS
jgi:tetraacyldisaccharide 4'-kinase